MYVKTLWKLRGKRQSEKEQEQGFWKGNHHSKNLEIAGNSGTQGGTTSYIDVIYERWRGILTLVQIFLCFIIVECLMCLRKKYVKLNQYVMIIMNLYDNFDVDVQMSLYVQSYWIVAHDWGFGMMDMVN